MIQIAHTVFKRNRRITKRAYPITFIGQRFFGALFSLLFPYILYKYVFQGRLSSSFLIFSGTGEYISYIVLGQSANIITFSTIMTVGRSLIMEIREGTLENLFITRSSKIGYFLGNYLEQLLRSFLEFFMIIILGLILGAQFKIDQIPIFFLFICISSFLGLSMSIFLAVVMVITRDTYITQNTVAIILAVVCGVSYPIQYLPSLLQYVSSIIPLTYCLDLFRKLVIERQSLIVNIDLLLKGSILSGIYFLGGIYLLKKVEAKLIENIYS